MTVGFISAININPANEINRLATAEIDLPYLKGYSRILQERILALALGGR